MVHQRWHLRFKPFWISFAVLLYVVKRRLPLLMDMLEINLCRPLSIHATWDLIQTPTNNRLSVLNQDINEGIRWSSVWFRPIQKCPQTSWNHSWGWSNIKWDVFWPFALSQTHGGASGGWEGVKTEPSLQIMGSPGPPINFWLWSWWTQMLSTTY